MLLTLEVASEQAEMRREGRSGHTFSLREATAPQLLLVAGCAGKSGGGAARQSQFSNKAQNPDISVKTLLIFKKKLSMTTIYFGGISDASKDTSYPQQNLFLNLVTTRINPSSFPVRHLL